MLTAEQLQGVLNDLPHMAEVKGDYYRVIVREYPPAVPPNQGLRFFEFEKTRRGWALVSVPQL